MVLCLAELLVSIDNTIVNVALPTMARELAAGTSGLQWVVDAYTLVFAGLLLGFGHLGDRYGRRRMLLVGIVGFGVASAVAATLDTLSGLVTMRAVMGAFAAFIFPATLALLTNIFTATRERVAAIGIWSAVSGVSVALGPVTGGWLLEHYSWHSVFWVNIPMAVLSIAATLRWVPESRNLSVGRLDVLGVLLSVAGIGTVVWAVIEGPQHGWTSPVSLFAFALGVALLAVFVVWERRHTHPVLDVTLFANPRFSGASAAIATAFFGLFGFIFLVTQYFQAVRGYSTLDAGLRTLPFALVIGALAPVAVQVAHRFGTTFVVSGGLALMSGGFAIAATSEIDTAYFGSIILSMMMMAAGLALVAGPATESIMGALTLAEAGAGSAVNDTTREVGGTLGVAVMGSVLAAIYRSQVTDALSSGALSSVPASMHPSVAGSVNGGLDVAARLHDPTLAATVREGFLAGMHAASWVAAAVTMAGAVFVAVALPARRQGELGVGPEAGGLVAGERVAALS
jgi:EmrB/QacA subfamily drug resistance transporter